MLGCTFSYLNQCLTDSTKVTFIVFKLDGIDRDVIGDEDCDDKVLGFFIMVVERSRVYSIVDFCDGCIVVFRDG